MANYTPTDEQTAAIDAFRTGENLVLEAGAGTGKTSTLKLMAEDDSAGRGIYVAYNRAIADDAKASFPRNVHCATAHSFAFRTHGVPFKHRLDAPRMTARQAASILGVNTGVDVGNDVIFGPVKITRLALDTVTHFCYSADDTITKKHVPYVQGIDGPIFDGIKDLVVPIARRAWSDFTNKDGRLKFQHDHYLKMWALDEPYLRADFILFDEAQDANPVIAGVVLGQTDSQLIAVGDRSQAIYGWRGAKDAMESWPAKHRLMLSQSFRFGAAVADEANKWLSLLEAPLRLTGYEKIESEITTLENPRAILCRTNAETIAQALAAQEADTSVAIVGGTAEIKRMAEAAVELMKGLGTSHPELMAFQSWTQVQEYVSEEGGNDLKVFVRLIDSYGPEKVIEVADRSVDERFADLVVSTAHKAKGREWDSVRIASDYSEPDGDDISESEAMLAYVAVTRAKIQLDNDGLRWVDRFMLGRSYQNDPNQMESEATYE